ncbi:MAG: helix-turn-helix domain-containing protein [Microbacteriaceae bacterium]|nr:helix-turn-helix domain-containing protein [Microbacteriaceae bacterium]
MSQQLDDLFSPYDAHLSVAKLADILGVTQKTVYDYLLAGELPAYRIGTRWLILRDEIKECLTNSSRYRLAPRVAEPLLGADITASDAPGAL